MISRILVAAVAILNLAPGVVAIVPSMSLALYGVALDTPALELTMRHRAVLLAAVGAALGAAAVDQRFWTPALALAVVSKVSFLGLYLLTRPPGPALTRVAVADVAALVVLAAAAWLRR